MYYSAQHMRSQKNLNVLPFLLHSKWSIRLKFPTHSMPFLFMRVMSEKFSFFFFLSTTEFQNLPPQTPSTTEKIDLSSKPNYLFFLDDIYSSFDVGESMHCGQNGVPLVLLTKFSSRAPIHGERRSVHEATEVEVLFKVSYPVFHLIFIKIWLHKSNLYVCLREKGRTITVLHSERSVKEWYIQ